jgi:hypothetical protein
MNVWQLAVYGMLPKWFAPHSGLGLHDILAPFRRLEIRAAEPPETYIE